MQSGLFWSRRILFSAIILLPAINAPAQQQDPFGATVPAAPAATAEPTAASDPAANQSSGLAVELPLAKRPPDDDFCRCVGESDSASIARIQEALKSPLRSNGLDFTETPLEEVINLLQEEYGIPIQIDLPALEAAGLGPSEKVTANLHNISLGSALRLMLKRLQLPYIIEDGVLMITTPEEADAQNLTCVYNVRGLVPDTSDRSMEALMDTIVSCLSTDTWAENGGGEAEIRALRPGLLVISQTRAVHDQIDSLLKAIRDMRGASAAAGAAVSHNDEVVTRLYAIQVQGNIEKLGEQVRQMIVQSIPDAQWEGRLPDGQSVTLAVLADRIVVRQTPVVQEKLASLLKDSGVAAPVRPNEMKRNRVDGAAGGASGGSQAGGGGFFAPPVH